MKKVLMLFLAILTAGTILSGCGDYSTTITQETGVTEEPVSITYEAMLYDNQGNNFLNFEGSYFNISPNKIKQYGWDSDGYWTSYYETSSVMTIEIDGHYIQSCGSTVIFKDTRLNMLEIPSEITTVGPEETNGYTVNEDPKLIDTYYGLKYWWYDIQEKGQNGKKVVLIQSQDGYNIGAFVGNDVTWSVADRLPKTTKIMIDGLPLYIHRCNFTIIDAELLNSSLD